MFFRFGSAVVLVVLIALAGSALETESLALRRQLSHQHYRTDILMEQHAKLRLQAQQLGTPLRLLESLEKGRLELHRPEKITHADPRRPPLLHWRVAPRGM